MTFCPATNSREGKEKKNYGIECKLKYHNEVDKKEINVLIYFVSMKDFRSSVKNLSPSS